MKRAQKQAGVESKSDEALSDLMVEKPIMSLVSFNVLYATSNSYIKALTSQTARYEYQVETLFPKLDADILCLQEVSLEYIEILEKSKVFKDNYQHTPADPQLIHFPMIVTKLPFQLLLNEHRFVV
jgi:mRNA deadenylase 3'-5' endonuclease subunit Ccr4